MTNTTIYIPILASEIPKQSNWYFVETDDNEEESHNIAFFRIDDRTDKNGWYYNDDYTGLTKMKVQVTTWLKPIFLEGLLKEFIYTHIPKSEIDDDDLPVIIDNFLKEKGIK